MVATNDPDAKNVFLIVKLFQPLSTGSSRKTRLNIHFSNAPNTKSKPRKTKSKKANRSINKRFGSIKGTHEVYGSSYVLDESRSALVVSGLMPVMPPYVLGLNSTKRWMDMADASRKR
ncbi:Abscisic acid receptor PYL9 [Senna tora]|uniref:Abscisic acid receptor PYL9 n=1 Tax=Senna tora TaxID=362788 RepID=A0A834TRP1_9FABA|nr:Abscisic acid receptor PYL9 [Senna tora]